MRYPFPLAAPEIVKLYFTWACNLNCPFCYEKEERRKLPTRPFEDFLQVVDELEEIKVFSVTLCGGEPFAHPRCFELIARIVRAPMRFSLLSNGTLIDRATAHRLAATGRCRQVQLSLDGMREFHDALRGQGSFDATVAAIRYLQEEDIRVIVNTVFSSSNYRNMLDTARFLEKLGVAAYRLCHVHDHSAKLPEKTALLSTEQLAHVIADIAPHLDELPHMTASSIPKRMYQTIIAEAPEKPRSAPRCETPWRALSIRPDGAIFCCDNLNCGILGWMGKDRLTDVWRGEKLAAMLKRILCGVPNLRKKECGDCRYRYYCTQYCPLWQYDHYCRLEIIEHLRRLGVLK